MRLMPALLLITAACQPAQTAPAPARPDAADAQPAGPAQLRFPAPDRPVAEVTGATWSDENDRDRSGEAEEVFSMLKIGPGSRVADIGAGAGYYTVRLAKQVGPTGKVIANDIIPDHLARLRKRVQEQGFTNISIALGDPGNARLPPQSVDVALMVHMYHEIEDPFGLLWHLHDSLRPGGRVAVIDADRPTARHGTPRLLLECEMAAVGFTLVETRKLPAGNYLSIFAPGKRPAPENIHPCRLKGELRQPAPTAANAEPASDENE